MAVISASCSLSRRCFSLAHVTSLYAHVVLFSVPVEESSKEQHVRH